MRHAECERYGQRGTKEGMLGRGRDGECNEKGNEGSGDHAKLGENEDLMVR